MTQVRIAILDYDIGNVKSILNAFEKIGANAILTNNPDIIMDSSALILPGVGAFAKGMYNLNKNNLVPVIYDFIKTNRPFLGICLGMQMLMEESDEFEVTKGLGLIKGNVIRMPLKPASREKLPHVSWNELHEPENGRWKGTLLEMTPELTDTYFVHSYVASPVNKKDVLAITKFGNIDFCAAVHHKNIFGTQFHPEKSGEAGLNMLKKFVEFTK
jgi:glutamine amidotransferase